MNLTPEELDLIATTLIDSAHLMRADACRPSLRGGTFEKARKDMRDKALRMLDLAQRIRDNL